MILGSYPQERITDTKIINVLNSMKNNTTEVNTFEYENEKYYCEKENASNKWFKLEPIEWKVTSTIPTKGTEKYYGTETLVYQATKILDYYMFNLDSGSSYTNESVGKYAGNDFSNSYIKEYLGGFYQRAFSDEEKTNNVRLHKVSAYGKITDRNNNSYTYEACESYVFLPQLSSTKYNTVINTVASDDKYDYSDYYAYKADYDHYPNQYPSYWFNTPGENSANKVYSKCESKWKNYEDYYLKNVAQKNGVVPCIEAKFSYIDAREPVTISFNTGTNEKIDSISAKPFTSVDVSQIVPTREQYTFEGWYKGSSKFDGKVPDGNVSLDAKWKIIEHNITYVFPGQATNSLNNPTKMSYLDSEFTLEPLIINQGNERYYDFGGWYLDNEYTTPITKLSNVTEDMTIYGKLTPKEVAITYNIDGGTLPEGYPATCNINNYRTIELPTPTKEGYEFRYWKIKDGSSYRSVKYIDEFNVNGIELVAVYTPVYTIVYNLNGGSWKEGAEELPTQIVKDTDLPTFDYTNYPVKEDYNFLGWYYDQAFTIRYINSYSQTEFNTFVAYANSSTRIVNLYAKFEYKYYVINLHTNEGECDVEKIYCPKSEQYPERYTMTLPTPTKVGYTFLGWNYKSTLDSGYRVDEQRVNFTSYTDIYAEWEVDTYDITYVLNEGIVSSNPSSYTYGDNSVTINNPTKEYYTFLGWKVNDSEELYETYTIEKGSIGDLILEAVFEGVKSTLTLNYGSGTEPVTVEIHYGDKAELPYPETPGYSISHWTISQNNKTIYQNAIWKYPAGTYTLTAVTEAIRYTLTMYVDDELYSTDYFYVNENNKTYAPLSKNCYTFDGWYVGESTTKVGSFVREKGVIGDITLKGYYVAIDYTITFDLVGGTCDVTSMTNVHYGDIITMPTPTKTDYEFVKWQQSGVSSSRTAGSTFTWNYTVDLTYVAVWKAKQYRINYVDINNSGEGTKSYYTCEDVYTVPQPTKYGGNFLGWSETKDGEPQLEYIIYGTRREEITLYAHWEMIDYVITFELDGGTLPNGVTSMTANHLDIITLPKPTKEGYNFVGWYFTEQSKYLTDKDCSQEIKFNYLKDITVKAIYTNETYSSTATTVTLGRYPQTQVTDASTISLCTDIAGSYSITKWKSSSYYLTSNGASGVSYCDVDVNADGVYDYRGIYLTSTAGCGNQKYNGFKYGNYYWFAYAPVTWDIVKTENGNLLVVSQLIIEAIQFTTSSSTTGSGDTLVYPNDYSKSLILKFLQNEFYNTVFNDNQKTYIVRTELKNGQETLRDSSYTTTCKDFKDNLFILSYAEVVSYLPNVEDRMKQMTDYAYGLGSTRYSTGIGTWYTRSADKSSNYATYVKNDGTFGTAMTNSFPYGIVPAMWLKASL